MIEPDLTPAQRDAVMAEGNVFVDAGPGTGKTHVIVARIARLVAEGTEPRRILVVTFSRRAVAELRERIGFPCEVRTFHGFASRLLEADGPRFKSRRLLDALTEELLLDKALARSSFATLSKAAHESERFRADFMRFAADLRRADRASVQTLRDTATPRLRDLFGVFDRLRELHDDLRASDLDDLISRAVDALKDATSPASRWLDGRYEHVLIDEFQDVDATQLELVARLKAPLFAVGDAAQAIYGFRGAVSGAIALALDKFAMRRFVLDESRRCPQIVCDLAAKTPFLGANHLKSSRDATGSVMLRVARTSLDEAALIADRIEDALGDGLPPEKIAVLLRSMRPLGPAVEAELRARNIPVAGGGRSAFLGDQNVEALRLGLRLLACPEQADRWAAFLGVAPLGYDVLRVHAALRGRSLETLDDAVVAVAEAGLEGATNSSDLASALRHASEAFVANDIGRAARRLVNGLGLAARAARGDGVEDANVRAAVGRLGRVVEALSGAQRYLAKLGQSISSAGVLDEFEKRIEALADEETPADDVSGVRLLTIHGAKGLEFDFVVIGDAVEGRFPSAVRRSTLLDDASLEAARNAGVYLVDARDDASLREEAALWYVGVTRTSDELLVTYSTHGADGAPQRLSRFVPAENHPADDAEPFERRFDRYEVVARESSDPGVIKALRASLADSPVLLALVEEGPDAFASLPEYPVTFTRRPSVSAAETWLACPRRSYYKHILRLKDDLKPAALFGSALHAVLAKFHEKYRDFVEVSDADVGIWSAHLTSLRESAWANLEVEPVAKREAYGRFADRVLGAYARSLLEEAKEHPFTVLACERSVESAYGDGVLRGTLDRVDIATDGTLTLRDYKSGRLNHSFQKLLAKEIARGGPVPGAVESHFRPQLALYRRGAKAAFGARVGRLEYVYLNGVKGDSEVPIGLDALIVDATTEPQLVLVDEVIKRDFVMAYGSGVLGPIATAKDEKTCMFCAYQTICPGPAPC